MGQGNHAAAPVWAKTLHHIVRHLTGKRHIRHRPRAAVLFTRVAHGDCKAVEQRHGGQVFGQLACTYEKHAVLGAKGVDEFVVINKELGWRFTVL